MLFHIFMFVFVTSTTGGFVSCHICRSQRTFRRFAHFPIQLTTINWMLRCLLCVTFVSSYSPVSACSPKLCGLPYQLNNNNSWMLRYIHWVTFVPSYSPLSARSPQLCAHYHQTNNNGSLSNCCLNCAKFVIPSHSQYNNTQIGLSFSCSLWVICMAPVSSLYQRPLHWCINYWCESSTWSALLIFLLEWQYKYIIYLMIWIKFSI